MGANQVVYYGKVIIDLTKDTVTPETLDEGITAHNAAGEPITGKRPAGGGDATLFVPSVSETGELSWAFPVFEVDSDLYLCVDCEEPYNEEMFRINENGYLEVTVE